MSLQTSKKCQPQRLKSPGLLRDTTCSIIDVREPDRIFCHCANFSSHDLSSCRSVQHVLNLACFSEQDTYHAKMARVDIQDVNKALQL